MASLLGKADSTLASMSYREAMADVAPDLKSVYQEEVLTQAMFQKGVKDHFDMLHAENTKLSDELDELLNTTVEGASDEENQAMFYNTINDLKDRLKDVPHTKKGDLERAKIRAEMSRLKDNSESMDQTLIDLETKVLNKDYNPDATGGPTLEFLKTIADGTAKKEIIKGRIMYSLPVTNEKISEKDLKNMVASNDPKLNGEFNKVTIKAGKRGAEYGAVWEDEREGYVTDYMNSFTTKTGFGNHIHKRQGNLKYTYAQYLSGKGDGTENMKIWNTLKGLGIDVPKDKDGDGKITEADFASKENGIALIKSLTQINHANFDFGIAKQAAAEFYTDNEAKKEFDDSQKIINRLNDIDDKDDDENGFPLAEDIFGGARNKSGTWIGKPEQIRIYNDVSNKKQEIYGADGSFYVLRGDGKGYMKFATEANTPEAGEEFYRSLLKEGRKKGLVGEDKGTAISFEQVLRNNAAYSSKLAPISTEVKSR